MRHWIRSTSVVALLMLTAVGFGWAGDEGEQAPCADCHEEIATALGHTPHGLTQRGAPSCVACHGDGKLHMDEGGAIAIPVGAASEQVCRSCHAADQGAAATFAVHATAKVNCTECHDIHPAGEAALFLLKQPAQELCASCHTAQVKAFDRPHGHELDNVLGCVACHDPHGKRGKQNLRQSSSGDGPCVSCHVDKRGPYVFPHVSGVSGDCLSCHEPHGSTNPAALIRPQVKQLCLECHSPIAGGTLGSQAVSSHDLLGARYRNCTTCHVAVHGSNLSPRLLK